MKRNIYEKLIIKNNKKIVYVVLDGLGGLPTGEKRLTELERAQIRNLDAIASVSSCGLHEPVGPGITPGSGPSHFGIFGYDPFEYEVGRGVLSALGIDFDLTSNDVAARGNFCTIDSQDVITDRRAGRISTEKNKELCTLLRQVNIPNIEVAVETIKEHRFLLVLRGQRLDGDVTDTDPHKVGRKPYEAEARNKKAKKTAQYVAEFVKQARQILAGHEPANMVLLRGFSQVPQFPSIEDRFGLAAASIVTYPMYRGFSKLLGMKPLAVGTSLDEQIQTLERNWGGYDLFYVHVKGTDKADRKSTRLNSSHYS